MKNELFSRIIDFLKEKQHHRSCDDGFYACPKAAGYFGHYDGVPLEKRKCECGADEASAILKEIEAGRVH
jgi:hypothetical protein